MLKKYSWTADKGVISSSDVMLTTLSVKILAYSVALHTTVTLGGFLHWLWDYVNSVINLPVS
jgi:hypothetical protein